MLRTHTCGELRKSDATKEVTVSANFDGDSITFVIVDAGKGFDPAQINQEELESLIAKRKDGGLGMRLIKTLMDEVQYEIGPGQKNELRMTKRIRKS